MCIKSEHSNWWRMNDKVKEGAKERERRRNAEIANEDGDYEVRGR